MPLMNSVRVVETEDAALIDSGEMGQEKGQIVSNGHAILIHPDLLAQNADAARASKSGFVVCELSKADVPAHGSNLAQVMLFMQHL
jgi:hypothetical protein